MNKCAFATCTREISGEKSFTDIQTTFALCTHHLIKTAEYKTDCEGLIFIKELEESYKW